MLKSVRPLVRTRVEKAITNVAKKIAETEALPRPGGGVSTRTAAPNPAQLKDRLSQLAKARRSRRR